MKGWCIMQDMQYMRPQNIEEIAQKEEYDRCLRSIKRNKITFQFYKEDYINLADLIYLLRVNIKGVDYQFTQLYRGQILIIMKMIAVHLLKIHYFKLCHNNLEPKNIWIKVGNSKLMTCFINKIDFEKAYFVNYKVPKECEKLSFEEDYQQIKNVFIKLLPFLRIKNGQNSYDVTLRSDDQIPEQIQQQINSIYNQKTLGIFVSNLERYLITQTQKLKVDFTQSQIEIRYLHASNLCVSINDLNTEFVKGIGKADLDSWFQNSIYNYIYLNKFYLCAKEFQQNYIFINADAINQKIQQTAEEFTKLLDKHIIQSFEDEIKKLDNTQEEVEKQFSSLFKIKIDMKDFIKEEYIDQWKFWLQNEIGNDFHKLQCLDYEAVKARILRKTKQNYLEEHKRQVRIELQKFINELQ